MRTFRWKRWLWCVVVTLGVLGLVACGGSKEKEGLFRGLSVEQVTVYDVSGGAYRVEGSTLVFDQPVEPLWETKETAQVAAMLAPFAGWQAKEHTGQAIDLGGTVFVCFDDKVLVEYCGKIDELGYGYFGRIFAEGQCLSCDLPAAFGEAMEKLLGQ